MSSVNITLNAAVRDNLFNLQKTEQGITETNNKLNSGKKINSVEDDPVRFYRIKALRERSAKFNELQEGIDSSVSLIKASTNGLSTLEDMMKGIKANLENMLQASSKKEFNAYRSAIFKTAQQMSQVSKDASYNGVSYINNTLQGKEVQLSNIKKRKLRIQGLDMRAAKLGLVQWNIGGTIANHGKFEKTYNQQYKKYVGGNPFDATNWTLKTHGYEFKMSKVTNASDLKNNNDHWAGKVSLYKNIMATLNGDLSTNYEGHDTKDIMSMFGFVRKASNEQKSNNILFFEDRFTVNNRLVYSSKSVHLAGVAAGGNSWKWITKSIVSMNKTFINRKEFASVTLGENHNLLGRVALANFTDMIGDENDAQIKTAYFMRKNINHAIEDANYGLNVLKVGSIKMATNLGILNNRKDFNTSYTKELSIAADNIELIDTSREIANYRASSARNKMGIAALNVASQQEANLAQLVQ